MDHLMNLKMGALAEAVKPAIAAPSMQQEPTADNKAQEVVLPTPQKGTAAEQKEESPANESEDTAPALTPTPTQPACKFSRAVNLGATRALKRPPTNNPLDSHTFIAGIRCRENGFLNQDFMLQSVPQLEAMWDNGLEVIAVYYPDITFSDFQNPAFTSFYLASADLYTDRLKGLWKGGQFHFTVSGFTNQDDVDGIDVNHLLRFESAPINDPRIFELWYGHKFSREWEVRVGTIYPFVRFASHQTSAIFQNLLFDYPGLYGTTDTTGNFLPYAQSPLGIQVFYTPNQHNQLSLFVGDGKADPTGGFEPQLWDTQLDSSDGVEIIAEYAYFNHSKDPSRMPGYYKLGFQANTGRFFNYDTNNFDQNGIYGGYITLEQMLFAEQSEPARSQGLLAWAKAAYSPNPRNVVEFAGSAGLSYAGLIPGRDKDVIGIGLGHAIYNDNAAEFNTDEAVASGLNRRAFSGETVLEVVYQALLTPWLMLIGSYQYIIDPSPLGVGDPSKTSGHVFLLNTRIAF